MLNEKDKKIYDLIVTLSKNRVADLDLSVAEVHKEIKMKGIYQSSYFIAEKLKKLEMMGIIKIDNWKVTVPKNSETS